MTDDECRQAYRWLLQELDRHGATDLAQDIEAWVVRGTVREEQRDSKVTVSVRVPLSGRERLVEALRMVVATATVPLMVQRATAHSKLPVNMVRWAPDYIEELEDRDGAAPQDDAVDFEVPPDERLTELAGAIEACDLLLREIEAEGA